MNSVELQLENSDGQMTPYEFTATALTGASGDTIGIVGIGRDLTEQKSREKKLLRNTRAIHEAPIGIVITDPTQEDNPIIYANEKSCDMTGYDANEVCGQNCRFLQCDETDPETTAAIREAIDNEEPISTTIRNRRKDGGLFWNHLTISPVHGKNGDVVNYIGFQQDITKEKQYQNELQRSNEQLREFTDTVSHDLRNPLSVVSSRLQSADRENPDSEHIGPALDAIDRTHELIDDLLTLSRNQHETGELESISLASIVNECWENVPTSNASVFVEVDNNVMAYDGQLKQLLENVFRNAIEHGGSDVSVTVGPLDNGFYIEDDGDGIDIGDRERVFESGYTTNRNGTGFGLRIVEQVVEDHGWEVTLGDGDLGGARFEITGVEFSNNAGWAGSSVVT